MTVNVMEDTVLEPGTIVRCKTSDGKDVEGEVTAVDLNKKALLLVSTAPAGSTQKHDDIHLLNMKHLSDFKVVKEPIQRHEMPVVTSQDCQKLTQRVREKVREKMALVNSIGVGVTPEAQSLFNSIRKTIDEVKWDGPNIVVMNAIFIKEPYTVEDMTLTNKGRMAALDHIKKIVQKHYDDKLNTSTHSIS